MSFLTGLVIGLLGGWLIEWLIDWLYWRRRYAAAEDSLHKQNEQLSIELEAAQTAERQIEAQFASLNESLVAAHANEERLQRELATTKSASQQYQAQVDTLQARLTRINLEHERLQNELMAARTSARHSPVHAGDLVASLPGTRPPAAIGNAGTANGATLSAETKHAAAGLVQVGTILDRDRLIMAPEALGMARTKPQATQRDPLIDINGIGPIYEQKLFDAGVWTFNDLAALSPERVIAIIHPRPWQAIDAEAWIAEAQQRAQAARDRS